MSFASLKYDDFYYKRTLNQSVSSLDYLLDPVKYNNCNKCRNEFKCLNDYEDHLCITLEPNDMFDIINDEYFTQLL